MTSIYFPNLKATARWNGRHLLDLPTSPTKKILPTISRFVSRNDSIEVAT